MINFKHTIQTTYDTYYANTDAFGYIDLERYSETDCVVFGFTELQDIANYFHIDVDNIRLISIKVKENTYNHNIKIISIALYSPEI